MLRSRRPAEQLTSLLQFWARPAAAGPAAPPRRAAATDAPAAARARPTPEEALRLAKDRARQRGELSALRKQWASEGAARVAAEAAAAEAAAARRAAAAARRERADESAAAARRAAMLAAQADARAERAAERAARLGRQRLREDVLEVAREERRRWLLAQSRGWVAEGALEERVAAALDHPVALYPAAPAAAPGVARRYPSPLRGRSPGDAGAAPTDGGGQ
jgi:hypothetical protein